jgi:hypothetical protein
MLNMFIYIFKCIYILFINAYINKYIYTYESLSLKDRLVAVSNGHLNLDQAALRVTAFVPASESSDRDCVAWMEGNSEGKPNT